MNRISGILALALLMPALAAPSTLRPGRGSASASASAPAAPPSAMGATSWPAPSCPATSGSVGTSTRSVFLAAESNGWVSGSADSYTRRPSAPSWASVQWYPMVEQGLYLKGGLGYSYATVESDFSTGGFAGSIGAGYDLRLARNFALTPYINYMNQFGGTYSYAGSDIGVDAKVHLFQFGLGFTWF